MTVMKSLLCEIKDQNLLTNINVLLS